MAKFRKLRNKLSEKLELPEDALSGAYRIQVIGDCAVLCGCKKLLKYQPDEIIALTGEANISFRGTHLKCAYFYEGTIEVRGDIAEIGMDKR